MGPLQANLSPREGAELLVYGYEKGINFLDTAELYDNYAHIGEALKIIGRDNMIIATKSYAYSRETAEASLSKAMTELKVDVLDIFLLHEQESQHTLKGHYEALEYFIEMKNKGYIKALGISTHHIAAIKESLSYDEIEVLHPIVNKSGLGIQDGTIDEMLYSLELAAEKGKGIYGMKPLGGGNLLRSFKESMDFVLKIPLLHSIATGMQSKEEIDINTAIFNGNPMDEALLGKVSLKNKKLQIADWCQACGSCITGCSHGALAMKAGKLAVDHERCVLCGYCSKRCPHFCIKVV